MKNEYYNPGEKINLLGIKTKPNKIYEKTFCKFPIRIHVTPIDCNRFAYGKPGGGGIGFAVKLNNNISISLAENDKIVCPKNKVKVVEHCIEIARALFQTTDRFQINIDFDDMVKEHSGFGSSAITMCVVISSINKLYGSPINTESIRRLIGYNFVEQVGDMLSAGLETGVGPQVVMNGGIAVLADDLRVIYSGFFLL